MNLAPGLLGAALLLWGWHNALVIVAVPLALLVELPRWLPWRWSLSDKDFHRLADASTLGFLGLALYQFDARGASGIYGILQWLPAVLLPLALAQLYSTRERIDYTALFLSVRHAVARGTAGDPGGIDFRLPYLTVCVVSAAGGEAHPRWLFASAAALLAWSLWCNRPRRHAVATWACVALIGVGLGFALQAGFLEARRFVEPLVMRYLQQRIASRGDPYRAYTAIGQIGELKLSDRIVLRVRPETGQPPPRLLRRSSFETFARNLWVSRRSGFEELPVSAEGTVWTIADEASGVGSVSIAAYLPSGKGLLAVPNGTHVVEDLPVDGLYRNRLGALKVLRGPEIVDFRARFSPGSSFDAPPTQADLGVPRELRDVLAGIARELSLAKLSPQEAVAHVQDYFARGFSYSLDLRSPEDAPTPLHDFLLETRRGHCEFFATATVLLLRSAGVPARYATGYAVQEYSELEERYVVRRRHAHSWALAYVAGVWRDVDTTPAVWAEAEAAQAPWWEPVYDLVSWLVYRFTRWRWSETEEVSTPWYLWLVLPLSALLVWRLYSRQRIARSRSQSESRDALRRRRGEDSPFYSIERCLTSAGHVRDPGESVTRWIRRLGDTGAVPETHTLLEEIVPLHYRWRFHPAGLDREERDDLRVRADSWLSRNRPRLR